MRFIYHDPFISARALAIVLGAVLLILLLLFTASASSPTPAYWAIPVGEPRCVSFEVDGVMYDVELGAPILNVPAAGVSLAEAQHAAAFGYVLDPNGLGTFLLPCSEPPVVEGGRDEPWVTGHHPMPQEGVVR